MAFEQERRQINRMLRQRLAAISLLLVSALALTWAWLDDAWLFGHDGGVRQTVATVTELNQEVHPARWVAQFTYDAGDGQPRQAQARFDQAPAFSVGERVPFVHSLDGRPMARPVSPEDRVVMRILLGMALAAWAICAILLVVVLVPHQRRRRLLDHGVPELLGSARVETRGYSLIGEPQMLWRLCGGQFDAALPGWREYHSDWQPAPAPVLGADTPLPPLLRDPADGKRHWLPVATWAAERNAFA